MCDIIEFSNDEQVIRTIGDFTAKYGFELENKNKNLCLCVISSSDIERILIEYHEKVFVTPFGYHCGNVSEKYFNDWSLQSIC